MIRILILEPDPTYFERYKTVLETEGFEVHHAQNIKEFDEKVFLKSYKYDVIVLGTWIPSKDEFYFPSVGCICEHMKNHPLLIGNSPDALFNSNLGKAGCVNCSGNRKYSSFELVETIKQLCESAL